MMHKPHASAGGGPGGSRRSFLYKLSMSAFAVYAAAAGAGAGAARAQEMPVDVDLSDCNGIQCSVQNCSGCACGGNLSLHGMWFG